VPPQTTLKRTPFHSYHRAGGGKLIEFAGFEMPVRYTGDVEEHLRVRRGVGLFDISHMGEFDVRGPGAVEFLDSMVTNHVAAVEIGQALYTPMCRPDGGIVDDLLIYRSDDHFMLVVNASNIAKDFQWLREHCPPEIRLTDRSDATALLAVQGPRAPDVLRGHVPDQALELASYRFLHGPLFGAPALISRTGYTGEDGFELYFDPAHAAVVWEGLVRAGGSAGLQPVGLGARDTLRLEMAYMLYGHDIDESTTPLEAGLGWTVKLEKGDFIGRDALVRQKQQGPTRKLVGLEVEGRRVLRHGMIAEVEGRSMGRVTSGSFSPSLGRPIGMAYVESSLARVGRALVVRSGARAFPATVVKRPFYTQGSKRS